MSFQKNFQGKIKEVMQYVKKKLDFLQVIEA